MIFFLSLFIACSDKPKTEPTTESPQNVEAKATEAKATKSETPQKVESQKLQDFGAPFEIKEVIAAKEVLTEPKSFVGKKVRVEGTVQDVCQKMGCWMVISEGSSSMRITTKDHKFFVAKDGAGSKCHIEGEVIARTKDPERTAHFESESSDGAPIPEKEAEGDTVYEIVASSIRFIKE